MVTRTRCISASLSAGVAGLRGGGGRAGVRGGGAAGGGAAAFGRRSVATSASADLRAATFGEVRGSSHEGTRLAEALFVIAKKLLLTAASHTAVRNSA